MEAEPKPFLIPQRKGKEIIGYIVQLPMPQGIRTIGYLNLEKNTYLKKIKETEHVFHKKNGVCFNKQLFEMYDIELAIVFIGNDKYTFSRMNILSGEKIKYKDYETQYCVPI